MISDLKGNKNSNPEAIEKYSRYDKMSILILLSDFFNHVVCKECIFFIVSGIENTNRYID